MTEQEKMKSSLLSVIDHVISITKFLSETSSSLLAVRYALAEVSPERFEPAYEKFYEGPDCALVRQGLNEAIRSLDEISRHLTTS
jgi:hypothetical protein